jgi:hypothetical protein
MELKYFVTEGISNDFRLIHTEPFGKEDIELLRLVADNGGGRTPLDVRFERLTVRAEEFIYPPRSRARGGLPWGWIGSGVAAIAVAALVYVLWSRSRAE